MSEVDQGPLSAEDRQAAINAIKAAKSEEHTSEEPAPTRQPEDSTADFQEAPAAEAAEAPEEPPALNENQQLKLRLRQEAQRYRQKIQDEYRAAEKIRLEIEADKQRLANEKAQMDQKLAELEAERELARKNPKELLTKWGRPLEEVVRDELEAGKPDARITSVQREVLELKRMLEDQKRQAEEAKKAEEALRAQQEHQAKIQALRDAQTKAEQDFLKLAADNPEKYPTLARLVRKAPTMALGQAYAMYGLVKNDLGREPSLAEIAATIEKVFGDEDETPKPKKKGVAKTASSGPSAPPNLDEMSEEERRQAAIREFKRIKAAEQRDE